MEPIFWQTLFINLENDIEIFVIVISKERKNGCDAFQLTNTFVVTITSDVQYLSSVKGLVIL